MELITKKSFLKLLQEKSRFDIKEFKGFKGEIVLGTKGDIRYLDLSLGNINESHLIKYQAQEQFLIEWILNIIKACKIKEIYIFPLEGKWLRGRSKDIEFLKAKELLSKYSIKNSFSGGIFINSSEEKEIKLFVESFSINSFRSKSDVIFLLLCEDVNFVLSPCDHFDYHIYPSNIKFLSKLAKEFLPSADFKVKINIE